MGGSVKKYLWTYPTKKTDLKSGPGFCALGNSWIFYGTKKEYKMWLDDWPSDKADKVIRQSKKWSMNK
jgi:hypothetical protein